MNRIILIGNGFDLAHGLKTKYTDFIEHFWENEKENVVTGIVNKIPQYIPYTNTQADAYVYEDNIVKIISPCKIADLLKRINTSKKGYDWFKELSDSRYKININGVDVFLKVEFKNTFLETISKKSHLQKWVDIEEEYYLTLYERLNDNKKGGITELNNDFLVVQNALEEYLTMQTNEFFEISQRIQKNIYSKTILSEFDTIRGEPPFNILIVNFNYTSTINQYFKVIRRGITPEIINIHGKLNTPDNPIIFGYGDEIGDRYKVIESRNDNRYLENIKSIKYLETDNYKNLLAFMDSDEFEIFIMGLSCGVSDRTLLNTMFEHKHCVLIKIFYHKREDGTDDFRDVVMNISRNFTDKAGMRKKVIEKQNSMPLTL